MNLDVGSGGGQVYAWRPRAEICLSYDLPKQKGQEQVIQGDAHHLPFREKQFENVFAFNLLEHVKNPSKVFSELVRVGSTVHIRQDGLLNWANYATPEHLWFQLPNLKFLPYPRTRIGIFVSKMLRVFFTRFHFGPSYVLLKPFLPPRQQYDIVVKR